MRGSAGMLAVHVYCVTRPVIAGHHRIEERQVLANRCLPQQGDSHPSRSILPMRAAAFAAGVLCELTGCIWERQMLCAEMLMSVIDALDGLDG